MNRVSKEKSLKAASLISKKIGDHKVITDPDILVAYSKDESHGSPSLPDVLVRVESLNDIIHVLEIGYQFEVPITPRSGGTGKSGGAIPILGGIVLSTEKMNRIIEINKKALMAVVEPGVITGNLHKEVEREGLFYPPDPASLESCMIGGNVAENSGGPRAFKYGVTKHYVLSIEAVLAGGQVFTFGKPTMKWVVGYDLLDLLVGSEGTLALFSKIFLRLLPLPPYITTLLVYFPDEFRAIEAVENIFLNRITPSVMEFMDSICLEEIRKDGLSIPEEAKSLVIIELDSYKEDIELVERVVELLEPYSTRIEAALPSSLNREKLWKARRVLSDTLKQRYKVKLSEDVVVSRDKIKELLLLSKKIGEELDIIVASYGHIGDGNLHVNLLSEDLEKRKRVEQGLKQLFKSVLELGGTISGEHGIGITKREFISWEQSPILIERQKEIKRIFDPKGVMNPGKIFP